MDDRDLATTIKEAEKMVLEMYRDIVENGPDLFSMHDTTMDAPFRFVSESFYQRLELHSGCLLGKPLKTIVDPRDQGLLRAVLEKLVGGKGAASAASVQGDGTVVDLRVVCGGGVVRPSSMSIAVGSQGLVVVTRVT